jgi:flagellar motor protein MotB
MGEQKVWYLQKRDGAEFGPVTLAELQRWAAECRLVAGNRVSQDREEWLPVEEMSQLGMDWVARRADGREYGPFNIKAAGELYRHGVLPADATLYNERSDETVELEVVLRKLGERQARPPDSASEAAPPATPDEPAVDADGDDTAGDPIPDTPAASVPASASPARSAKRKPRESNQVSPVTEAPVENAEAAAAEQPSEPAASRAGDAARIAALIQAGEDARAAQAQLERNLEQVTAAHKQTLAEVATLTNERDVALTKLAALETETATRGQACAEQTDALRAEVARLDQAAARAEALQDALDSQQAQADKQAQALHEARQAAKASAEQARQATQALVTAEAEAKAATDGLAKQLAFTKKNNDTLLSELDDARQRCRRMTHAFAILATAVMLVVSALLLFGRGCRRAPAAAPPADPELETPARGLSSVGAPPLGTPTNRTANPRLDAPAAAAPVAWPALHVEGVAIRADARTCALIFEAGVFARMTVLSTWGKTALSEIARQMDGQWDRFSIVVEGHTDNEPMRVTELHPDNYHLGLARAQAVVELLTRDCGVPAGALRATSAGDSAPPYPNDTAANRRRNRTVILKLKRNQG